jgi:hypothetical protein
VPKLQHLGEQFGCKTPASTSTFISFKDLLESSWPPETRL